MENREIKFRGKPHQQDSWVYGNLVVTLWNTYIIPMYDCSIEPPQFISVDPKTVGQYTGLKDKNGKEIYEGDEVFFPLGILPSCTGCIYKP
jgi:uncharacterized phage protein (TIGR01671 family)